MRQGIKITLSLTQLKNINDQAGNWKNTGKSYT